MGCLALFASLRAGYAVFTKRKEECDALFTKAGKEAAAFKHRQTGGVIPKSEFQIPFTPETSSQ